MSHTVLIEKTKELLAVAKKRKSEMEGGIQDFLETLEDSDTFYDEAYSVGYVDALEAVLALNCKKMEN